MTALLFDLFGVIASTQSPAARQQILNAFGPCDPEQFWSAYWAFRPSYDAGFYDSDGYWALVAGSVGSYLSGSQMQELTRADLESWSVIDPAMVSLIHGLRREGHTLGLLSNIPPELADAFRPQAWLGAFTSVGFSCDIGYAKPDPRAFAWSLGDLGKEPHEVIFIDDNFDNVAAARSVGLTGIPFTSGDDLTSQLAVLSSALGTPTKTS